MESAIGRPLAWRAALPQRVQARAAWIWLLAGGLVLLLGIDGGGYDVVVRSQVAIVVWWVVVLAAAWGLVPGAVSRAGWAALALFGALLVWSALAITWSLSSERSLEEVSRLACYAGVLALALTSFGDRRAAVRHAAGAVAAAVVVVAVLALISRLRPGTFPAAQTTAAFLPGAHPRLGWPLNYWNALAALMAIGLPLLLAAATSARTLWGQALAAAAVPVVALCGYLTFSRGGAGAGALAVLVFIALSPARVSKLVTLALTAAASAALIAGAVHRHAVEQGATSPAAVHQGRSLLLAVILVCAGVAVAQTGIGLAVRHADEPRWLRGARAHARLGAGIVIVLALALFFAAHGPARLDHAWQTFKQPREASLHQNAIGRYGALSGNGRYTYWQTAIHAMPGHLLGGYGPGTFQLVWMRHAPIFSFITNAHSLYVETLTEVGVVGLVLLAGFLLVLLGGAIRLALARPGPVTPVREPGARLEDPALRAFGAAIAAALAGFAFSAAVDWVWQVPVIPAAVLLLGAATLVPAGRVREPARAAVGRRRPGPLVARIGLVLAGVACLVAIGLPLATTAALRASQSAANAGSLASAASDAALAVALEPDSASAHLQQALVAEMQGNLASAIAAASRSASVEPANWEPWFVLSRLQAESGHPAAALAAYERARSLDPRSPLFTT